MRRGRGVAHRAGSSPPRWADAGANLNPTGTAGDYILGMAAGLSELLGAASAAHMPEPDPPHPPSHYGVASAPTASSHAPAARMVDPYRSAAAHAHGTAVPGTRGEVEHGTTASMPPHAALPSMHASSSSSRGSAPLSRPRPLDVGGLVLHLGPGVRALLAVIAPPVPLVRDTFLPASPSFEMGGGGSGSGSSASGSTAIRTPGLSAARSEGAGNPYVGTILRCSDEDFVRAVLRIPAMRVVDADTLALLFDGGARSSSSSSGRGSGSYTSGKGSGGGEPECTPRSLLPVIPRPKFEDFFPDGSERAFKQVWPNTWQEYHSCMAILLLEETRAMLSATLREAARKSVSGGSRGGGQRDTATGVVDREKGSHPCVRGGGSVFSIEEFRGRGAGGGGVSGTGVRDDSGYTVNINVHRTTCIGEGHAYAPFPQTREMVVLRVHTDRSSGGSVCLGLVLPTRNVATAVHVQPGTGAPARLPYGQSKATVTPRPPPEARMLTVRAFPNESMAGEFATASGSREECANVEFISLGNIATALQAYQSIVGIAFTPYSGLVLRPNASRPASSAAFRSSNAPIPAPLLAALQSKFDDTQLGAIVRTVSGGAYQVPILVTSLSDGSTTIAGHRSASGALQAAYCEVTAIIGPPGTGKTRTILGIISALRAVLSGAGVRSRPVADGGRVPSSIPPTAAALKTPAPAAAARTAPVKQSTATTLRAPDGHERATLPAHDRMIPAAATLKAPTAASSSHPPSTHSAPRVASSAHTTTGTLSISGDLHSTPSHHSSSTLSATRAVPVIQSAATAANVPTQHAAASVTLPLPPSMRTPEADSAMDVYEYVSEPADEYLGDMGGLDDEIPMYTGTVASVKRMDPLLIDLVSSSESEGSESESEVEWDDDIIDTATTAKQQVPPPLPLPASTSLAQADTVDEYATEEDVGVETREAVTDQLCANHLLSMVDVDACSDMVDLDMIDAGAVVGAGDGMAANGETDADGADGDVDSGILRATTPGATKLVPTSAEHIAAAAVNAEAESVAPPASPSDSAHHSHPDAILALAHTTPATEAIDISDSSLAASSSASASSSSSSSSSSVADDDDFAIPVTRASLTACRPVAGVKRPRVLAPSRTLAAAKRARLGAPPPPAAIPVPLLRPTRHVRVLVCAASNAAVDELVSRLLALSRSSRADTDVDAGGGLLDEHGLSFVPNVVRVGAAAAGSDRLGVADRSLERLAHAKLRRMVHEIATGKRPMEKRQADAKPIAKPGARAPAPAPTNVDKQRNEDIAKLRSELVDLNAQIADKTAVAGLFERHGVRADRSGSSVGGGGGTAVPIRRSSFTKGGLLRSLADSRSFMGTSTSASGGGGSPSRAPSHTLGPSTPGSPDGTRGGSFEVLPGEPEWRMAKRKEAQVQLVNLELQRRNTEAEIRFLEECRTLNLTTPDDLLKLRLVATHETLMEADVVATTLAGTATLAALRGQGTMPSVFSADAGFLWENITFDAMIIDEAGQAVEAETLIPLRLAYCGWSVPTPALTTASTTGNFSNLSSCRRLILVGDPLQLPATVISKSAAGAGLDISLFERITAAGIQPMLLQTQYRMHGSISAFSSKHFYRGLVKNAASIPLALAPLRPHASHTHHSSHGGGSNGGDAEEEGELVVTADNSVDASTLTVHHLSVPPHPPHLAAVPTGHTCSYPLILIDVPQGVESKQSERSGGAPSDPSFGNDAEARVVVAFALHVAKQRNTSLNEPASAGVAQSSSGAGATRPARDVVKGQRSDSYGSSGDGVSSSHRDAPSKIQAVSFPSSAALAGASKSGTSTGTSATGTATAPASSGRPHLSIGIITPYREQVRRIRDLLRLNRDPALKANIIVSTVDSFQGQEMDVIIISCVRSGGSGSGSSSGSRGGGIGFLSDPRRLNVAVTRAKQSLVVVGNLQWLAQADTNWRALVTYMSANGVRMPVPSGSATAASSLTVAGTSRGVTSKDDTGYLHEGAASVSCAELDEEWRHVR